MPSSQRFFRGTSLIETLVVIAILGMMLSLLLPALQQARESANETVCKNNLYQLSASMHHFRSVRKRLPAPNQWTIDLLPYLEEASLEHALRQLDPTTVPAAKFLPAVYACTAQPDLKSFVPDIPIGHYLLIIDAPFERRGDKIRWKIADRPSDLPEGQLPPWFVGAEIHPAEFERLVNEGRGPHRGGAFFP